MLSDVIHALLSWVSSVWSDCPATLGSISHFLTVTRSGLWVSSFMKRLSHRLWRLFALKENKYLELFSGGAKIKILCQTKNPIVYFAHKNGRHQLDWSRWPSAHRSDAAAIERYGYGPWAQFYRQLSNGLDICHPPKDQRFKSQTHWSFWW